MIELNEFYYSVAYISLIKSIDEEINSIFFCYGCLIFIKNVLISKPGSSWSSYQEKPGGQELNQELFPKPGT